MNGRAAGCAAMMAHVEEGHFRRGGGGGGGGGSGGGGGGGCI